MSKKLDKKRQKVYIFAFAPPPSTMDFFYTFVFFVINVNRVNTVFPDIPISGHEFYFPPLFPFKFRTLSYFPLLFNFNSAHPEFLNCAELSVISKPILQHWPEKDDIFDKKKGGFNSFQVHL